MCDQQQNQEFSFGGSGGRKSPSGVQERSSGRGSGDPPEAEAVCNHCLWILTAETIKILNYYTIYLLILVQYVSRWGLSDPFGGLCPLAHACATIACNQCSLVGRCTQDYKLQCGAVMICAMLVNIQAHRQHLISLYEKLSQRIITGSNVFVET